jgi:hypothetical protein
VTQAVPRGEIARHGDTQRDERRGIVLGRPLDANAGLEWGVRSGM